MKIGMDVAAAEFYRDGKYDLDFKNSDSKPEDWLTGEQLADLYRSFIKDYPSMSLFFNGQSYLSRIHSIRMISRVTRTLLKTVRISRLSVMI